MYYTKENMGKIDMHLLQLDETTSDLTSTHKNKSHTKILGSYIE